MRLINFLKETLDFRTEIKPATHKPTLSIADIAGEFTINDIIGIFTAKFETENCVDIAFEAVGTEEIPKNLSKKERFDGEVKRSKFNPFDPTGNNKTSMSQTYGAVIGCIEKLLHEYKFVTKIGGGSSHEKLVKFYSSSGFKRQIMKNFPNGNLEQNNNTGIMTKN